ncbi:MAG: hypothetical protein IJ060_09855, partial [Oscillospiraceae bacterium]|nr:hypothetical protein [Oscillospiraceae bacterium]
MPTTFAASNATFAMIRPARMRFRFFFAASAAAESSSDEALKSEEGTAGAAAAGATHFYLIFEMGGTATDTVDGVAYAIGDPDNVQCFPQPL